MAEESKVQKGYPTAEDFEAWTADSEVDAAKEAAQVYEVKSLIMANYVTDSGAKEPSVFILAPSGNVYRFPLGVSISLFDSLSTAGTESIEALKSILAATCPDDASALEDEPVVVVNNILKAYGQAVTRVQGVSLGE